MTGFYSISNAISIACKNVSYINADRNTNDLRNAQVKQAEEDMDPTILPYEYPCNFDPAPDPSVYEGHSEEWIEAYVEGVENIDDAFLLDESEGAVILTPIHIATSKGWEDVREKYFQGKYMMIKISDWNRYKTEKMKFIEFVKENFSYGLGVSMDAAFNPNMCTCIKIYHEGEYMYFWIDELELEEIINSYEEMMNNFEIPCKTNECFFEELLVIWDEEKTQNKGE